MSLKKNSDMPIDENPKHKLEFLDELRAIAQLGLNYSKDSHDIERYTRLLKLCSIQYSELSGLSEESAIEALKKDLGHVTPKVGVNAVILSEDNKFFLTKRHDDNCWELPGGWAEVGEGPREALQREIEEETSLTIEAGPLIEVFHRLPDSTGYPYTSYHLLFLCSLRGGQLELNSESTESGYFNIQEISDWHRDHKSFALAAQRYIDLTHER